MKKLIFPMLCLLLLAASCAKEGDEIVNKYYVVDGDYVYVDYITVEPNTDSWQTEIELLPNSTYRTISLYYECVPRYGNTEEIVLDSKMITRSYVVSYWLDNDFDIPMPKEFTFTDAKGEHTARFSYVVTENVLRIICESLDGDWDALKNFLNIKTFYFKFGCHIVND